MPELLLFGLYVVLLVPIAWLGKKYSVRKSPEDFYLANRELGFFVLLLTLFATQYSGNTFIGFPGEAYRAGYSYIKSVTFMMAIVGVYLLYAPPLRRLATEKGFVTPCDWIHHRFRNLPLTVLSSFLMSFALLNFLLAQLVAMGHAAAGFTHGRIPYEAGVVFLALVIALYETTGGMRSVAWTDFLQGGMMLIAVVLLGGYLFTQGEELALLPEKIMALDPKKVYPPTPEASLGWLSSIVLVGLGGAMYPQAIQRIYAARSTRVLKYSLAVMVFLPLATVLFAYAIGILAIPRFPGLEGTETDTVMTRMLAGIAAKGLLFRLGVALLLLGAMAAMMSTADSVLLSLSSIVVQDLYGKTFGRNVSEEKLLRLGKWTSWILTLGLIGIALRPGFTLWRLLEIKFEVLVQVAPAFILGFYLPNLRGRVALLAMSVGTGVALCGFLFGPGKWMGFHPGTLGCLINFLICLCGIRHRGR